MPTSNRSGCVTESRPCFADVVRKARSGGLERDGDSRQTGMDNAADGNDGVEKDNYEIAHS